MDTPEPALGPELADRDVGGLGVHLVRRLAARIDHAREGGHNVLVVQCAAERSARGGSSR